MAATGGGTGSGVLPDGGSADGGARACPWKGDITIDVNLSGVVVLDDGGVALVSPGDTRFYGCDFMERRRVEQVSFELTQGDALGPLGSVGYLHVPSRVVVGFDGTRRLWSAFSLAEARGLIDANGIAYACSSPFMLEAYFPDGGGASVSAACASLHARGGRMVVVGTNSGPGGVGTLTSSTIGVDGGALVVTPLLTTTRRASTAAAAISSAVADVLVPGAVTFPLTPGSQLPPLVLATAGSGDNRTLWLEQLDVDSLQVTSRTCEVPAVIDTTFRVASIREEPTRYLLELVLGSAPSSCRPSSLNGVSPKTWNISVCSMPGGGFGAGQARSHVYALTLPKSGGTGVCGASVAHVLPDLSGINGLRPAGNGDHYAAVNSPSGGMFRKVIRKFDSSFRPAQAGGGGAGTCTATYEGPTGDIQRDAQCQAAWSAICAMQSPAGYCAVYNDPGFGSGPSCPYCP
jgi:hypothetical protein